MRADVVYKFLISVEFFLGGLKAILLKSAYGTSVFNGPYLSISFFTKIRIRSTGKFQYGRVKIRGSCIFFCDGGLIKIADGVFINSSCHITSKSQITIGENTLLGEGIKIYDHDHELSKSFLANANSFEVSPVSIGKNCWIGSNVIILRGVSISDGVTIGAGAIVTKSITSPGVYVRASGSSLKKVR
jgi:acetyltransferase-like isoleucine patch superfamily enzyme